MHSVCLTPGKHTPARGINENRCLLRRFCTVPPAGFRTMEQEESPSRQTECEYQTPPTSDLLHLLLKNRHPTGPIDEVWPGVHIGNDSAARDKETPRASGITHVVNAAHGPDRIDTGARFYADVDVDVSYFGVEAADKRDFDLTPYFCPSATFIQAALSAKGKCTFRTPSFRYLLNTSEKLKTTFKRSASFIE
ncbi:dual specificity protein phosphatase 13-like [Scleropages formosus]|uniref:dual specificity protein phosphatase 13-like n=1 Tax=Scleropages formosus TaxID=113540 RepID=UPI0008791F0D|nr:dual specificity protein phosphatase 13-like [Scleropages formosus]